MADGRTCEEWFFVFENALLTNSIPYTVTLSILSTFLKGTALHLLKNYMDSGKTDWNGFKDLLRTTFLPKDHEYRLRVQLTKLTQNNDSIDTFNRKFQTLEKACDIREEEIKKAKEILKKLVSLILNIKLHEILNRYIYIILLFYLNNIFDLK